MNKKRQSNDRPEILTLDNGISVVKRALVPGDFDEMSMAGIDDFVLYNVGSLVVSVEYPVGRQFPDGVVYRGEDITALAFHGEEYQGKWVSESRQDATVKDIVAEVEKKHRINALLVCNPTQEDPERDDLIYIVGNEASPVVRGTSPDLRLGLFPKIHGGGYWSIFGKKYHIPYPQKSLENLLTN